MKKFLVVCALLVVTGEAFTQNSLVNRAQGYIKRNQLDEAQAELTKALTSGKTKDLAFAWNVQGELYQQIFVDEFNKMQANEPLDTAKFSNYLNLTLDAYKNCLENDTENEYTDKRDLMPQFRVYFLASSQLEYKNLNYSGAFDAYDAWLNFPKNFPIIADHPKIVNDTAIDRSQVAYYACLAAYQGKLYDKVSIHMDEALKYTAEIKNVRQLHLTSLLEQEDTTQWLAVARTYAPKDEIIAQNVLAHYSSKGDDQESLSFAEELLSIDPNNKIANYSKGVVLFSQNKFDEALPYFEKSIEADPDFTEGYYNAGVCCCNYGYAVNEAIGKKKLKPAEYEKEIAVVKEWYLKAEPFFLKVMEQEPDNPSKWASRLSTIYYISGEKEKEAEMNSYLN